MRKVAVLMTAGVFALACAVTVLAAPGGSEGPANCTFAGGTTTCSYVGQPVTTGVNTSSPDVRTGCTTTTTTYTTTTIYTAHRGTYNSSGAKVTPPENTVSISTSSTTNCPVHGSAPLLQAPDVGSCNPLFAPASGPQVGTVYWYETGSDVQVHADFSPAALSPSTDFYFLARCVYLFPLGTSNSDGGASFDGTYSGAAGQTVQFDGSSVDNRAATYFLSPIVTL